MGGGGGGGWVRGAGGGASGRAGRGARRAHCWRPRRGSPPPGRGRASRPSARAGAPAACRCAWWCSCSPQCRTRTAGGACECVWGGRWCGEEGRARAAAAGLAGRGHAQRAQATREAPTHGPLHHVGLHVLVQRAAAHRGVGAALRAAHELQLARVHHLDVLREQRGARAAVRAALPLAGEGALARVLARVHDELARARCGGGEARGAGGGRGVKVPASPQTGGRRGGAAERGARRSADWGGRTRTVGAPGLAAGVLAHGEGGGRSADARREEVGSSV